MKRFENKVVLVTGGRSGIGKAIVETFKADGARVFTAQRKADQNTEHVPADLSDPDAAGTIVEEVVKKTGQLDILVNNAGVMMEDTVETCSIEDWQATLMVNLTSPFLLIKHALPHLKKSARQEGAIVNVGSIEGMGSNPQHPAYCASKAGLHALTRAVAVDHGTDGVRCNVVAPGWINTELNQEFIKANSTSSAFVESLSAIHPLGRTGEPEEVAAMIAFLASTEARFITGQVFTVDGGRMAKLSLPS